MLLVYVNVEVIRCISECSFVDIGMRVYELMYLFFLMKHTPPKTTQGRSSAASDVYRRKVEQGRVDYTVFVKDLLTGFEGDSTPPIGAGDEVVPYTHLRAHETLRYIECRLLHEKKKT